MSSLSLPESPPTDAAMALRCREAEWIDTASTLSDFDRPVAREDQHARGALGLIEALCADAVARELFGLRGSLDRQFISCELPRFEIPLGPQALDTPTSHWNHRDELPAELIDADPLTTKVSSVAVRVRRGMILAASVLPLVLAPTLAQAGEGQDQAQDQNQAQSEALGAVEGPAAPAAAPAPAKPAPPPAGEPAPTESPVMEGAPAPGPTTAAPVPPPRVSGASLSLTSQSVWEGLHQKRVTLEMKNGQTLGGVVVAQSQNELAIARAKDGVIVSVPKADIGGVKVRPATAYESQASRDSVVRTNQSGRGMVVGGSIMAGFGGVATLAGAVLLALSPSYIYISLPLLLPGLANVAGGAVLIHKAKKKRAAYNKAWGLPDMSKVELMPTLNVGRNGGQAGLILRF